MNYMRRSLNTCTYYLNKWNGEKVSVFASSYLLNIVFPSKSRSVPYKLRKSLRDFFCYFNDLSHLIGFDNQFLDVRDKLWNKFHSLMFLPLNGKSDYVLSWHDLSARMIDCLEVIDKFKDCVFDVGLINSLDLKRKVFLSRLFSYRPDVDLSTKAYVVRKKFNRQLATVQL